MAGAARDIEPAVQFEAPARAEAKKSAASRGRCIAARSLANTGEVIRHSSLTRLSYSKGYAS